jgi:signal transduction histidine kinase
MPEPLRISLPVWDQDGDVSSETDFAPAERSSRAEVEASIEALGKHPLVLSLLDAADVCVMVLNRQRQILVGNAALLAELGVQGVEFVESLRPGEALGCIQARKCPGGCGTAKECSACGAALAILESQRTGEAVERECLMTVRRGGTDDALELRIRASQTRVGQETFTVVGLRDISAEKRREALERVFLHDISNTLSPLLTWAELLATHQAHNAGDVARRIAQLARRLRREIEDQRVLLQAESGTLEITRAAVELEAALAMAMMIVEGLPEAKNRTVAIARVDSQRSIVTDESLLVRVLVNMLKNALEATPEGGEVKVWVEDREIRVWNAGAMAPQVILQVFKRSFSTKAGRGRGLGTFSMKLFGERYLGGVVDFTSSAEAGTTFFIHLPS